MIQKEEEEEEEDLGKEEDFEYPKHTLCSRDRQEDKEYIKKIDQHTPKRCCRSTVYFDIEYYILLINCRRCVQVVRFRDRRRYH